MRSEKISQRSSSEGYTLSCACKCRYSVELENLQQKVGRKKHKGRATYSLREEEDGWETISEAQNAAATLAIFEVFTVTVLSPSHQVEVTLHPRKPEICCKRPCHSRWCTLL